MNPVIRAYLLNRFVDHWNSWSYKEKPSYFWIREYHLGDVDSNGDTPQFTWAKNVWLLDENGLHERNPLDWRRFEILIYLTRLALDNPIFSGGVHEIGIGCFAPRGNSQFIYEEVWGGRWGSGFNLAINEAGTVISESMAWIS